MSELILTTELEQYRDSLEAICKGSTPFFMEVEGRPPLSVFEDIYAAVPELPKDKPVSTYAFVYEGEAVGYTRILEDDEEDLYYILEFTVAEKYRRQKLGTTALKALDELYKKYTYSELLVSAKNYGGLNFWVNSGYSEITLVLPPEAQNTAAVEMNLRRKINREKQ